MYSVCQHFAVEKWWTNYVTETDSFKVPEAHLLHLCTEISYYLSTHIHTDTHILHLWKVNIGLADLLACKPAFFRLKHSLLPYTCLKKFDAPEFDHFYRCQCKEQEEYPCGLQKHNP